MIDDELVPEFVEESQRSLTEIELDLLKLESGSAEDTECINRIFRAIHTVKGAASFLEMQHIVAVSHRAESLLVAMRDGRRQPNVSTIDAILKGVDGLLEMLGTDDLGGSMDYADLLQRLDLALAGDEPNDDADEPSEVAERGEEDSGTKKNPLGTPTAEEPSPKATADIGSKAGTRTSTATDPTMRVPASVLNHLLQTTGDMVMARNQLLASSGQVDQAVLERLSRLISEVHETVIKTRKGTTGGMFSRFTRVVRDLALKLGKEAALTIEGGDLELDRSIIESFADPLTHLIRNCMDHALETPEQRLEAGKSRSGEIGLRSFQQSGEIVIEIEDDGRGIDPEVIRNKAVEKGVISADKAAQLSEQESLALIFEPGFSTKDQASDVSGRGVGMDVVKTNVQRIGGTIAIKSVVGSGTKFTAHLPLAKALVASSLTRTLIVSIGDESYAIPDSAVCEIVRPDSENYPRDFRALEHGEVFHLRESILPMVHLADAMSKQRMWYSIDDDCYYPDRRASIGAPSRQIDAEALERRRPPNLAVVIMRHRQHRFALVVNEVVGIQEAIVQPIPKLLEHCTMLTGHAVLGDGRCMFILDIGGIANKSHLSFSGLNSKNESGIKNRNQEQSERLLIFNYAEDEYFAIPLEIASLVQTIDPSQLRRVGSSRYYPVRERMVSLLFLDQYMRVRPLPDDNTPKCIIHPANVDADVAICCGPDLRVHDLGGCFRSKSESDTCAVGLFEWQERLVTLVDLYKLIELHSPDELRPVETENREARILCADDSLFFQKLIQQYLMRPGWEVTMASTGREAWDLLNNRPNAFDLVISDINMPEMNGFELAEKIRLDCRFDRVPLIALTTQVDEQSRELGLAIGFERYVAKINKFALQDCIDGVLDRHRGERAVL